MQELKQNWHEKKMHELPELKEKDWRLVQTNNGRSCVVIGALGSVIKEFDGWIDKLRTTNNFRVMQKTALLGTARILRKVLEM